MDYGGVMTTSMTVSFGAFCVENDVDPRRLTAVLAEAYATDGSRPFGTRGIVALVETGAISGEEFDERLAAALSEGSPAPVDPADLSARLMAALRPEPRMIAAVEAARGLGLKTALVSNTWGVQPSPDRFGSFDAVVLSGREGLRKPNPEIYLLTAFRLGVPARACVFVDDIPANVAGAEAVGMAGILHRDSAITVRKLEALFGLPIGQP
jgi:putative hydrolase of the HAD superfamily